MAQHVFPPQDSGSDAFYDEDNASSVDAGLVERALRGDGDAFATLFDRHASRVYALAYRILGREGEAEDATQDAFLHALNALPTLRRGESFRPWVMRIATNLAWATLRQRMRLPQAELTEAVVETHPDTGRWGSPEAMGLAAEDQRAVRLTLDRLAPTHRAALAMREIGGLSYADIAASLGTTTGSVEVLLFRARARFRDEYRKVELGAGSMSAGTASALSCVQTPHVLAVLADHEGSDEERARAEAHARQCAICTAQLQGRKDSRKLLLALPLTVPTTLKAGLLSKAGPILVSHAARTSGGAGGALTAAGGVSEGSVAAVSGAAAAGGTAAGGTAGVGAASALSIVGVGGLTAMVAAIAVVAVIAAAVVVFRHAPSRPTPSRSSTIAASGATPAARGGSLTPTGRSSLLAGTTPTLAAVAVRAAAASATARAAAASSHPTTTPVTGRVARGNVGGSGPGAIGTVGVTKGTSTAVPAFGVTGSVTAPAHDAPASATVTSSGGATGTSSGGATGTVTSAVRLAGGLTATPTVTTIRPGAKTAPAVATSVATASGGAAGTATAVASLAPTAATTPAAPALAAMPEPISPSMTTTPVPAARTAVSYLATATARPPSHGTTRMEATPTPRATTPTGAPPTRTITPAVAHGNHGRPSRSGPRSVTAVPTTRGNAGRRSTAGVAALSHTPVRRPPVASPTRAAARSVSPPPLAKLVATPVIGHGASVIATVTALPGRVVTTVANTVSSAPTVVATLIPVLPTTIAVVPSVIPSAPALPLPTIPSAPVVPPLATLTPPALPLPTVTALPLPTIPGVPLVPPLATPTILVPPLPTVVAPTVVVPTAVTSLPTVTVVASTTPVPTVPVALPSSIPTVAPTIAIPTVAPTAPGLLPSVVPSVPVPPDGSNATPTVPTVGIGTPPAATATPTSTATPTTMATATPTATGTPTAMATPTATATAIPTASATATASASATATGTPTAMATPTASATATASATPLPALLDSQDIGNVGVAGSISLDVAGLYTIAGSGGDIWGTADAFHFVYLSLTGDGQIVAHVVTQTDTDPWAKAGVMIRETLDPSARFADMVLTPDRGAAFQRRTDPGANAVHTGVNGIAPPAWVKLARSGSTLTGFVSRDGTTWTLVGTDTVPMAPTVFVGLAVTAHNNALLSTAVFDHVVVSAGA